MVGRARAGARLYTCEHASNRVPAPFRLRPGDRRLLASHWGWDIGARSVAVELARLDRTAAVLSRFSRLLIDPNRDPDDPTAVLAQTDDGAPTFNRRFVHGERVRRFHEPFHSALAAALLVRPSLLVSVHTFTPIFRGTKREVEAGVLFDQHDELAEALVQALRDRGLRTEANEPYSGKAGLIYSAARHGAGAGIPYLEIELRQDLVRSERRARAIAARVRRALDAIVSR